IDPQEIALHWLLVISCGQTVRTPVLSIPGMHKFMWKQRSAYRLRIGIDQEIFSGLIVTGFVMLQTEMSDLIAERKQEVILAVVRRAEDCLRFLYKFLVMIDRFRRCIQGFFSVRRNFKVVVGSGPWSEIDAAEVFAGKHGRIDQRRQR